MSAFENLVLLKSTAAPGDRVELSRGAEVEEKDAYVRAWLGPREVATVCVGV